MTDVVAAEVAEQEFERILEWADLVAPKDGDDDVFNALKETCMRAIQRGSLCVDDDGCPVYTPRKSEGFGRLKFKDPDGSDLQAVDGKGKSMGHVQRTHMFISSICEIAPPRLAKMKAHDVKVLSAVAQLFLVAR